MKKIRKILSSLLAMSMMFTVLAVSASAAVPTAMSAEQLAYMDLDSAPYVLQQDILDARAEIIFEQSWTVDGAVSIINLDDGTEETLPEFSELFPGWDIPVHPYKMEIDYIPAIQAGSLDNGVNAILGVYPDNGYDSEPFTTFVGTGSWVGAYAWSSPVDGAHYNLGFTNTSTGQNLGWIYNLSGTQGAKVNTQTNMMYSVRGSVNRDEYAGGYYMIITDNSDVIGDFRPIP